MFIKILDYPVSVAARASSPRKPRQLTSSRKGLSGDTRTPHRAGDLKEWSYQTPLMDYSIAVALEKLIAGQGHVWDFYGASLQSSGGCGPNFGYGNIQMKFTGGPFDDEHFMRIKSSKQIKFRTQLASTQYTVLFKRYDGSVWKRYAFLDSGTKWREGATTGATLSWFSVSSGYVTLDGVNDAGSNADNDIAEMVVLPWRAHSDMLTVWTGSKTTRWSQLPVLEVSGDSFAESSLLVTGKVTGAAYQAAKIGSVQSGAHKSVSFDLVTQPVLINP